MTITRMVPNALSNKQIYSMLWESRTKDDRAQSRYTKNINKAELIVKINTLNSLRTVIRYQVNPVEIEHRNLKQIQ